MVLTATLPRFLLPGDRSTIHLDLDNVEGQPGDYVIAVSAADAVLVGAGATQTLTLRAKAARFRDRPGQRERRRQRRDQSQRERSGRLCGRAQLHPDGEGAGANSGTAYRQAARQGRERDVVERHVCRSRSRHRQRFDLGRLLDGARRGKLAGGARSLSVPLFGADHEPRLAAALCQRARHRGACCAWTPRPRSTSALPSRRCSRGRTPPARSASGASAATISGSIPTSPIF